MPAFRHALAVGLLLALSALPLAQAVPARASSLQIQPALVEVTAPGAASTVTLRNDGQRPINVQIRVFSWSQSNGTETLQPTQQVIASPPQVVLAPGMNYVARVVRLTKHPVVGEESYRLLIDELPDDAAMKSGTVRLLVRYSVPVFFGTPDRSPPDIKWKVSRAGGKVVVSARNSGGTRLRISALALRDAAGHTVSFGKGLLGYALGASTMSWTASSGGRRFASSGHVAITGQGNDGAIDATAPIVPGP